MRYPGFGRRAVGALVLAVLGTALPAAARAQETGNLTGMVYDSLIGAPLEGARVWLSGGTRAAVTDRGGRFTLERVPAGSHVIAFEHSDLDSIGLSNHAARVVVMAGRTLDVVLATRSAATLRAAACGAGGRGPLGDTALAFGDVRDAETGVLLAGAQVRARWVALRRTGEGRLVVEHPSVITRTDSVGQYYLCGVPGDQALSLQARADSFATGETEMLVGPRLIHRRDLAVSREIVRVVPPRGPLTTSAAAVAETSAAPAGRAVLFGEVVDERGRPRAGAVVGVDAAAGDVFTDERGRFRLGGLPSGSHMAMARLVGYAAARRAVQLSNRDSAHVVFRVRAITTLDTIQVAVEPRLRLLQAEIQERLAASSGYVLDEQRIAEHGTVRSLFEGIPNVVVEGRSAFDYRLIVVRGGARQYCTPAIFIDGVRGTIQELNAYRNGNLVALEVYPRQTAALGRFTSMDDCGVVLAWTRLLR